MNETTPDISASNYVWQVNLHMSLKEKINAWLALMRVPNLFTVPGDVILGYIIAESFHENSDFLLGFIISRGSFGHLGFIYTCSAIFCAYIFGLITNDIADLKEDMLERPYRPIPAGKISIKAAYICAIILFLAGLTLAGLANMRVFVVMVLLFFLIISYNCILKKHSKLGPLTVSVCRLLSITAGYYAAGVNLITYPLMYYLVSFTWLVYFLRVSLITHHETAKNVVFKKNYFLLAIPAIWIISSVYISGALEVIMTMKEFPPGIFPGLASVVIFYFIVIKNFITLNIYSDQPKRTQASVGELIKAVIFLQASGCAFLGYPFVALALFLLWIPAHIVSRKFYSS